ncbi:hypothetical protein ACEPAI_82 [Sanghuangporus weigelae]
MLQFVKAVCRTMERIAPLRLAESWDNVCRYSSRKKPILTVNGVCLEESPSISSSKKILLTIDLTPTVAREAIDSQSSLVIAYHPTIFRPLSSLTLSNPLQRSLLQLAQAGISVYSPHTALDSVYGGINDWLAEAFVEPNHDMSWYGMNLKCLKEKNDSEGGSGRLLTLPLPGLSIVEIVERVKRHLGITQVQVTRPYENPDRRISTVAICAGSGGSMFEGIDTDLYFTGEMQHHEVLAARAKNRFVLLCGHTNTERGYLKVLRQKLVAEQKEESDLVGLEVEISKMDEHPLVPM